MAQINVLLEKQLLTVQNRDVISSGDANYDMCSFTFDSAWEGFTKTAVFYQDKANVQYAVLGSDDACTVPAAAMAREGRMYIGVFGIKDTAVLTSTLDNIEIARGGISGDNVSTEPTDDVFLSIISKYQSILDSIASQNAKLDEANAILQAQMELLEKVNAFEIEPLEQRLSAMEITLGRYGETISEEHEKVESMLTRIQESSFLIRDVQVVFDSNNEYRLDDGRVDEGCIVDAYFDAMSAERILGGVIYVESFDGYILFTTATKYTEPLNCTVEVRRY